jgi:hypothetical protein
MTLRPCCCCLLLLLLLLCCRFDAAGVSIIDFPDGARNGGVMRCLNYTAHLGRSALFHHYVVMKSFTRT